MNYTYNGNWCWYSTNTGGVKFTKAKGVKYKFVKTVSPYYWE